MINGFTNNNKTNN